MSTRLKVGVIGVGGIARTHMPGWEASQHADVVVVSDINEQVARSFAGAFGISHVVSDPAAIFADPEIDIVDICTPNMSHAELTIAALNAGKHVICEKPLAPTPDEIRRMIAARDASGKMLMTAQHFRFAGMSQAMKAEIDSGVLGEIYHARSWMIRRGWIPVRPGFIYKQNSGGGPCIDIGVHILDLTLWLMGNPKPVTVTGVARRALSRHAGAFSQWGGALIPDDMDVEDYASAFVRFENGATLILEVSWLMHHNTPGEDMQMWLYGMEGGAHWPKGEFMSTNYATKQFHNSSITLTADKMEPHALECVEFARAVAEGAPSPVPAEQSLDVMAILDGIYRSQQSGREVTVS